MIHVSPDAKFRIRVDGESLLVKCFQMVFKQGKRYFHLQNLEPPYRMFWFDDQTKKEMSPEEAEIIQPQKTKP